VLLELAVTIALPSLAAMPPGAVEPSPVGPADGAVPVAARADTLEDLPPDWQQHVAYVTEGVLDEEAEVLRAAQVVRYTNASPDTLRALYFHLYLNAFRPHSVWAREEQRERLPFDELEEPDYGFERLRSVRLVDGPGAGEPSAPAPAEAGTVLEPAYPHAPDSTVVRLELPQPLPPGEELALRMRWDARPATLCRRQCRRGRSWDFAQWYPRVAVYDQHGWNDHPLHPQGEFYGEFGSYDVTLELAEDQVIGATGVPVRGDPGWEPVSTSPVREPLLHRDWYGESPERSRDPGLLDAEPAEGRRRVRFRAERVHHFAWSVSPDYRYEGTVFERGDLPDVAVHVLFRPGDSTWDEGVAAERTVRALSWLQTVFRPYPYPQLTNLHRIEGGGTEFPMMIMDGSASEGLIVHEVTHQYAHGILANNEWRQAWLDEGLTSFLDTWYAEEHGSPDVWRRFMEATGVEERVLSDPRFRARPPAALRGFTVEGDTLAAPLPVDTRSERFPNYAWYGYLSYTKPQAVFYMLREMLGKETTRRVLRAYYDRHAFGHVTGAALQAVAEEVSGRDLDWFFDQWIRDTAVLDWSLADVDVERDGDGWRTRVTVRREGEAWMPVTLAVGGDRVRIDGREREIVVEVATEERPETVELDPDREVLDVDRSNDRLSIGADR